MRLLTVLFASLLTSAAFGQVINMGVPDSYQVGYAANLSSGDSYIDMSNTGASSLGFGSGTLCENFYVFDQEEELLACCSCTVTSGAGVSLSVNNSLLSNTVTGVMPTSVTIDVVSTLDTGVCDATSVTAAQLAPGAVIWNTHLHPAQSAFTPAATTECPFASANLTAAQLVRLTEGCSFTIAFYSGAGICKGCQSSDQ